MTSKVVTPDVILHQLDSARFQWFHLKAILISGAGFFTDAYDLFTLSVIRVMISFAHFNQVANDSDQYGQLDRGTDLAFAGTALIGTLIGQVVFGVLGDRQGRKKVYGWTLYIMAFTTIGCAATTLGSGTTFIAVFCVWRFLLGFGVGGDYPLAATITSEYASTRNRGMLIAAVFSMQGLGILCAAAVALAVSRIFRDQIVSDCQIGQSCAALSYAWRICVGLGAAPALLTCWMRRQLPETPRFTLHVHRNAGRAGANIAQLFANVRKYDDVDDSEGSDSRTGWWYFHRWAMQPRVFWTLFGTCSTWFLLDVAFYSQNLLQNNIFTDIGYSPVVTASSGSGQDIYNKVYANAAGNAIVTLIGTVPGYYVTIALIERMGRKPISYMGFTMMTILLAIMALAFDQLRANAVWAFIILYALVFFFANFGPNSTTFIIPAECYPTRFRCTCHGISAACGKLGAIVGVFGFGSMQLTVGTQPALGVLAVAVFLGILCTYFVPETKGKSLEELADELSGAAVVEPRRSTVAASAVIAAKEMTAASDEA